MHPDATGELYKCHWIDRNVLRNNPYYARRYLKIHKCTQYLGCHNPVVYGRSKGPIGARRPIDIRNNLLHERTFDHGDTIMVISSEGPYHVGVVKKNQPSRVLPLCKNCLGPLYDQRTPEQHRRNCIEETLEPGILNLWETSLEQIIDLNVICKQWSNFENVIYGGQSMSRIPQVVRNRAFDLVQEDPPQKKRDAKAAQKTDLVRDS